jgi:hypothetical protein
MVDGCEADELLEDEELLEDDELLEDEVGWDD